MIKFIQFICLSLLFVFSTYSVADDIVIGVRAHNGEEYAIKRWMPTINYLQQNIPQHKFHLQPILLIKEMETLVSNNQLDFVLTQPVSYVDLERLFAVTRMLTLQKKQGVTQYGSVIITRSDRNDIQAIKDIKGKTIAGVTQKGFGGWLIGYQELQNHGINSYDDFKKIDFVSTQNNVVKCILDGDADVGILRTGILEKLSSRGEIDLAKLRVLNQQSINNFPYKLSTALYPEWAFAKTTKVAPDIAKKVALALLSLPKDSEVAVKGDYSQWSIPLNYNSVHELMKRQKVGSYSNYGHIGVVQFINQYRYELFLFALLLTGLFLTTIQSLRSNKALRKEKVEKEKALSEIKILRGIIPICSYCHSIRNDEGSWDQIEAYISKNSEVNFSHGICPECLIKARSDAGLDKK